MKNISILILTGFIVVSGCSTVHKNVAVQPQPAPVVQEKWSFVVVGDSRGKDNGINSGVLSRLVDAILKEPAKFVLFPGDLMKGYSSRAENVAMLVNWRTAVMDKLADKEIAVYPVRGNHEMCKEGERASAEAWREVFSGKYALPADGPEKEKGLTYSFIHSNALFLCLDSYVETGRINQQWVDDQLSKNKAVHVFVQTHEPLFSLKGGHRGTLQLKPERRDALVDSLTKAGNVAFFCGHDHWYDHAVVSTNNVKFHQFTIGTAGAPLLAPLSMKYVGSDAKNVAHAKCHGYAIVEISGPNVNIKMKQVEDDGTVKMIDELSYKAAPQAGKPAMVIVK